MQQSLQIGKTQWIYVQEPNKEVINQLAQEYGFHEVIVDDLIEINAQSKIDSNSKHFFLALTFTKYLENEQRYLFNELDVIIGDNYIITTNSLESTTINNLFEAMKNQGDLKEGSEKESPYYILYRIIDEYYDKTMKSLALSSKKLLDIQENIASKKAENEVVQDLMNEDLNKIFVKHNFLSQEDVMDDLIEHVDDLHAKQLNVYFNSLKVKLARIISTINALTEKNESLMSAYNTFIGIKSNNSVSRLTFVNAIFMPLTLIAGIGGMSERSMMTGSENWRIAYPLFLLLCAGLGFITFLIFRKLVMKK
ncbi:MAG: hypothetical protein NTX91_00985 [candidate division SR1 bacterium]|nr:hypothetical protein [candidate division SR1 bacterium]